jgi:hypothetical protein
MLGMVIGQWSCTDDLNITSADVTGSYLTFLTNFS